jgi:hypothetical protein
MNALKKISARVKQLRKKNPGRKYSSLQKQAGKEFKAGKLKAKRKPAAKKAAKRKPAKRKAIRRAAPKVKIARRKVVARVKPVKPRKVKVKAYKATRYKKVGKGGKSMMPLIALAAVGVGAYLLLRKPATVAQNYGYIPTGNPVRDNSANSVLTWATAAGLTATAITKLIQAINSSSDSTVQNAAQSPDQFAQSLLGD